MQWRASGLLCLLLFVGATWPQATARPKLTRLPTANDAYALAAFHAKTLPLDARPYSRYLWITSAEGQDAQALSLVINELSRATVIRRPDPLGQGKLLLAYVDLRWYAPRVKDLREWLEMWEELQFDPALSQLITKGTLKFLTPVEGRIGRGFVTRTEDVAITVPPFTHTDGKVYTQKWTRRRVSKVQDVTVADLKDVELIRLPDPTIDRGLYAELVLMTGSQAPVVTLPYFVYRGTSAVKDQGVYADLYGGLFYEFSGIRKGAKKGTDEDVLFAELGIGNVQAGVNAEKFFDALGTDARAAVFKSKVTGRPRRMDFFRASGGSRITEGSGLVSITHDLRRQDIDINTHPVANLLNFKDAARELIFEKRNGLHGYALFNGQGVRQDVVPPDITKDHTIPEPEVGDLQPSISCYACHGAKKGFDGWQPVVNDVTRLVNRKSQLDIFGDVSRLHDPITDTIDRLAGLYRGDPEVPLRKGRDDYARNVLFATGVWKESQAGQTDVVQLASERIVKIWRDYWYTPVGPEQALQELGIECDKKLRQAVLNDLLRPDVRAAVGTEVGVIIPESPLIGFLRIGEEINRSDWGLISSFARERARHRLAQVMARSRN